MAMIFTQEMAAYLVDMKIAEEKCRMGKNFHWCEEAGKFRKLHAKAELNYRDRVRTLKRECGTPDTLEKWR
jgi:hypothetical protein